MDSCSASAGWNSWYVLVSCNSKLNTYSFLRLFLKSSFLSISIPLYLAIIVRHPQWFLSSQHHCSLPAPRTCPWLAQTMTDKATSSEAEQPIIFWQWELTSLFSYNTRFFLSLVSFWLPLIHLSHSSPPLPCVYNTPFYQVSHLTSPSFSFP